MLKKHYADLWKGVIKMFERNKTLNLYQRLNLCMEEVTYLQKDDTVSTGANSKPYKAISDEHVTEECRKAFVKHGIVIVQIASVHKRDDTVLESEYNGQKKQTISRIATLDNTYRVINIDDPKDYIDAVSSGTGVDSQDKAVGKAATYARKYLQLNLLLIPTGDDPDKTSSAVIDEQQAKMKPVQPAKPLTGYERLRLEKIELQGKLFQTKEEYMIWRSSLGEIDEKSDSGLATIVAELRKLKGNNNISEVSAHDTQMRLAND